MPKTFLKTPSEKMAALTQILRTLQEIASTQSDEEFKEKGCHGVFKSIQSCKRLIDSLEEDNSITQRMAESLAEILYTDTDVGCHGLSVIS